MLAPPTEDPRQHSVGFPGRLPAASRRERQHHERRDSTQSEQLAPDVTYTYVPGAGFTDPDSFTVTVADGGRNLLPQAGPTVTTVNVGSSASNEASSGFFVVNDSGESVKLVDVQKESGCEECVYAPPAPTIVAPGDRVRFELVAAAPADYGARAVFAPCSIGSINRGVSSGTNE